MVLLQAGRGGVLTFGHELVLHLEGAHPVVGIHEDASATPKPEAHLGVADLQLALREFVGHAFQHVWHPAFCPTAASRSLIQSNSFVIPSKSMFAQTARFPLDCTSVPPAPDRRSIAMNAFHLLIADQPMGDVDHHVADTDHGHMFSHIKGTITEPG
ncbi:MAG: hypothetical protein U0231_16395 [Nitrospiraceae bacterium]